jgi:2-methylcitrate dehydratase
MTRQRDLVWRELDLAHRTSVAHQYARFATTLRYDDIPAEVVHQARRCLLDALGCAIGAYDAPGRPMMEATARALGGREEATIFGSGLRTSVYNAALVNSFLVRFLDYNDMGGGGHNSDAIPSLLAVAEQKRCNGRDVIAAMVVSYELGARFRDAVAPLISSDEATASAASLPASRLGLPHVPLEDLGWGSDLRGGLNQPPALGRLLGLDEEQIANAIGLTASHTLPLGVLDAHREECVMAKNIRFGWVACDAIVACLMAQNGITGPVRVVEAEGGVNAVVARGELNLSRLVDLSGWKMLDVRFKSTPANGPTASHVQATLSLVREHDLKPEDIDRVHIRCALRESKHTTAPAKKYPRNAESADHSAFYANAHAVVYRSFGPDSIDPTRFTDPAIVGLIERIVVEGDPQLAQYQAVSRITTRDGRTLEKRIDAPHGIGPVPLSDTELERKFSEMAERQMPAAKARELIDLCWSFDRAQSVDAVMEAMSFARKRG